MRTLRPIIAVLALLILPMGVWGQTIATDNAGNYVTDWTGDGGTGFGDWAFLAQADGGFAGNYLSTVARTISTGNKSWGMYANGGTRPIAAAFRGFDVALAVGQTISVDIQNGGVETGGKLGFHLRTNNVTDQITNISAWSRFEFSFTGGETHYEVFDAGSDVSTGLGWTNGGTRVAFTLVTANTYDLKVTRLSDSAEFTLSGRTLGGVTDNALNSIAFFVDDVQEADVFFNNLTITQPEVIDPPAAIVLTAPANSTSDVALRPTFTWEENVDATSYTLQVSTDSEFGTTAVNATGLTDESYTTTVNLRMATTYHWRVRGVNGGGNGEWSAVRSFTTVLPTVTLHGNGGGGFGEVVGGGSLYLTHDATHVYVQMNKGLGDWNDVLTLYLDTKSGGFASTATLTDEGDEHRKAASAYLSDITFPTGFEADYAITLDTDFAGLWVLSTGTFAGVTSLSAPVPSNTTAVHSFRVAKSDMTFDSENTFKILAGYMDANTGFRSNESFSIGLGNANPGNDDVTLRSFHNYPAGTITADVRFFGSQGWRFLANPFAGMTFDDYLAPLWTQGITGSDFPGAGAGNANVRTLNAAGQFVAVSSQTANMDVGAGYAVGVFADDTYGVDGGFPKTVTVTGTPSYTAVGAPMNGENTYTLAGNPYPFTVDFDDFAKTGVADIVYVYDYEPSGSVDGDVTNTPGLYRSWNGTAGSLTGGRIAPFQGFLAYQNAAGASLTMELADRASPAVFRGKEATGGAVELTVSGNGLFSNAWLDLRPGAEAGLDAKDAFKIASFDARQARLYTVSEGVALDINHLPMDAAILPLVVESTEDGLMTLAVGEWSLPEGWRIYLTDGVAGTRTRLETGMRVTVEPTRVSRKGATAGLFERVEAASVTRYALEVDPGTSTSVDRGPETVDRIALHGAYPNPFNPSTVIGFTLDAPRATRLAVYDMLGRQVANLIDGQMEAGEHRVTFDASTLTSGVYIVRLEAGGEVMTRLMTLIK